jgi:hypothetical protein
MEPITNFEVLACVNESLNLKRSADEKRENRSYFGFELSVRNFSAARDADRLGRLQSTFVLRLWGI